MFASKLRCRLEARKGTGIAVSVNCLMCGPKVCGEYWLYVVADKDCTGPVKVGISNHATRRLAAHRRKTGRDLMVHFKIAFSCQFKAMDGECLALDALSEYRVNGDWFDLPVEQVIATVRRVTGHG